MSDRNSRSAKRGWLRFSLRTLFALLTVAAVALGLLGNELARLRRQRQLIAKVKQLEGHCYFDYESECHINGYSIIGSEPKRQTPRWLRSLLGNDAFAYVAVVDFRYPYSSPKDADISFVADFPRLQALDVYGRSMSDVELERIAELRRLRFLRVLADRLTDNGLKALRRLKSLEVLEIDESKLTDNGLAHLSEVQSVRSLNLHSSAVTDDGLIHVGELRELERLELNCAQVTGRGFVYLAPLKSLTSLELISWQIMEEATRHLSELPRLRVLWLSSPGITDEGALRLADLPELELLILCHDISAETVIKLKEALPNCDVTGGPLPSSDEGVNASIR